MAHRGQGKSQKDKRPLPSKEELLTFIQENPARANKREVGRAFGVTGSDRIPLKRMLRELAEEGHIERQKGKAYVATGELPPVTVVKIVNVTDDGDLEAVPVKWDRDSEPPTILFPLSTTKGVKSKAQSTGVGDHVLARMTKTGDGAYEASAIKKLERESGRILGVFQKVGKDGRVLPVDKGARSEFAVRLEDSEGAKSGELVLCQFLPGRGQGLRRVKVDERLGNVRDARSISLIAIHEQNIPFEFPDSVETEAANAKPVELGTRTDLRDLPFVTIDPRDARDHDDAMYAEYDGSENNQGGFIIWVAIADVAHYVRSDKAMDKEALRRGNSCYFPDRVVPMLPESLSADLCSLHEDVDRPCLAVRMTFDKSGQKKSHKFHRALIRSRGSLTYQEVQDAFDGKPNERTTALAEDVIKPLHAAYKALQGANEKRGPLDLDLPEHRIELDQSGHVTGIALRDRFDAHRLVEDCMVQANVCAAETLEKKKCPLIYRVHDKPSDEKLAGLAEFLKSLEIAFTKGQAVRPQQFNTILAQVKDGEYEPMVNEIILRTQSQAVYSAENLGHFGLNLARYAHFTSPIRRYADLIVHRALIRACGLGDDGLNDHQIDQLDKIAEQISNTERRAMAAERDSNDRYIAAYMEDHIGAKFKGRITGVTHFGLFIRIIENGADGLAPIRSLGREHFHHDEEHHKLVGELTGDTYRLGDQVEVELREATPLTGGLILGVISDATPGEPAGRQTPHRRDNQRRGRGNARKGPRKSGGAKRKARRPR